MPTIPAIKMQAQDGIHSHERLSSRRGKLRSSVGIAKIPVYSIKQSLLSERADKAICPARSWLPVKKIAMITVPPART
jgi:hypothetical protein